MVKKALVYVTPLAAERAGVRVIQVQGACSAESKLNATLVIHGCCKRERVFTESEVQAILHDMRSWISPDDGEEGRMWETRAKLHGIVLDPA